jgi:hypothetical protein
MTPEQVHEEVQTAMRELRLELREMRVDVREQFSAVRKQLQRIKLLIWLPVATGLIQIIVALITHK